MNTPPENTTPADRPEPPPQNEKPNGDNPKPRWGKRLYSVLLFGGLIAVGVGFALLLFDAAAWRWLIWSGLMSFTCGTVFAWWWETPDPTEQAMRVVSQTAPQVTSGGNRLTRFLASYLEPFFAWVFAYPLFPLQIALFWAIAWLDFAGGLGVPNLVWGDESWMRLWAGIAVSLLFNNVLFIRALLDRRPGNVPPDYGEKISLFWFAKDEPAVRRVGAFLLWTWAFTLIVFYLPYCRKDWVGYTNGLPGMMLLGIVIGILGTLLLVVLYHYLFSKMWQKNKFFNSLPAFRGKHALQDDERPLHALAGICSFIPAAALLLLFVENVFFNAVWSPVWLFCLIAGLFNAVYGFVAFHLSGLQYVLFILASLMLVVSNTNNPYRMVHPGLEEYNDKRVNLDEDPKEPKQPLDLITTKELLQKFHSKWANGLGKSEKTEPQRKPKMVLIATTGGGIQAAVWTGVVLEQLESAIPGDDKTKQAAFRDHIRLITGASGGTQAASLYVADFENRQKLKPLSEQLAEDSLWPTFQTMLMHDWPLLAWPGSLGTDRGRSLERQWKFNTGGWLKDGLPAVPDNWYRRATGNYQPGVSPFSKKFHDLRTDERECNRPSLILSPMLVEDCRRLLITNLSMDWFTETQTSNMNPGEWYQPTQHPDRTALPAIEFWRYFPDAREKFEVGTGARMAATFPFVGPAVSLPTIPPRRVVDAGYFDNYGMNLAAVWLYKHREFIKEHTSGVVIVEIRAYPRRAEKLRFDTRNPNNGPLKPESFNWAVAEAGTPFTALYNLYARSAYFRNDQAIDILDEEFNGPRAKRPRPFKPFFTTVCFECEQGGSLSWTLPKGDFAAIRSEFDKPSESNPPEVKAKRQLIQDTIANLQAWFGDGGTR